MGRIFSVLAVALMLVVSGCSTYSEEEKAGFDSKIRKFTEKSSHKYIRSESGLYYYIEQEGEGDFIKFTDEVSFTYTGKFLDGQVFDGRNSRKPVTFPVSQLIEGWKEIMFYLKKGGKASLIMPPYLGYGDRKLNDIPPNSILVFDMAITDVK